MTLADRVKKALNIRSDENMYRNLELEKALTKVVEATKAFVMSNDSAKYLAMKEALKELDERLKECGV